MPITDDFVAEINEAIESRVDEKKNLEPDSDVVNLTKPVEKPEPEPAPDPAPELTPTPAPEPEPRPAPASAPAISDGALTEAIRAGLSIEEAREFGSDKLLMRAVEMVRAVAAKAIAPEKKSEEDLLSKIPKLDPEQFEPEVIQTVDALRSVIEQQQNQIKELRAYQGQISQVNQASVAQEIESWFDGQIEKLGEDFGDVLGKGKYSALDKSTPQFIKRDELASQMAVLASGYRASGRPMPAREKIFEQAAKMVLSDEYQKNYEKKLSNDLGKREKQHINRPGGQKLKTHKEPIDEVVDTVNQFISLRNK
jgi:hypothetical protein